MKLPDSKKNIWFLWFQGWDNAPLITKRCMESWKKSHRKSQWKLHFLDDSTYCNYVNIDDILARHPNMPLQAKADTIRARLLKEHGGVWVDSTCFCMRGIESWISQFYNGDFFAFPMSLKDHSINNWFIISMHNSPIIEHWDLVIHDYWMSSKNVDHFMNKRGIWRLYKFLRQAKIIDDTRFWHTYFAKNVLKVQAYFWYSHIFDWLCTKKPFVKAEWEKVVKKSPDPFLQIQNAGMNNTNMSSSLKKDIDKRITPFHKLSNKRDISNLGNNTILDYLFDSF